MFTLGNIVQYNCTVTGGGSDRHDDLRLGGGWSTSYLSAMANLKILIDKAKAQNAPHYAGIAKILLAYNLNMTSSVFENIPYSKGFDLNNLKPDYDSQESIMAECNKLLDEAIVDLDVTTSARAPFLDDIIYPLASNTAANITANRNRWKAAARALKARFAIQKSAKNPVTAANEALAAITAGGIASNTDDLQVVYNTRNFNPWHTNVALGIATGNLTVRHSAQIVDAMNGTTFGIFDPRLPIIGGRTAGNAAATTWIGGENGVGGGNVDYNPTTSWHSKSASPTQLITFAEQKFIQAEAEFLKNGGTTTSKGTTAAGYQAYLDGITASMNKLAVPDTGRTRYLASPLVAVGAANLTLQHIMSEKYKALFLNLETWNDMRRWDYSPLVFKDLALPSNQNAALGGKWIERSLYPFDELSRNADVVAKNLKASNAKMWLFTK
jgi:hypothetical protein